MNSREFIKAVSNITLRSCCRKLKISPSNISSGKCDEKKLNLVKNQMKYEILAILFQDGIIELDKDLKENGILYIK